MKTDANMFVLALRASVFSLFYFNFDSYRASLPPVCGSKLRLE
jgi:hypothetical protein